MRKVCPYHDLIFSPTFCSVQYFVVKQLLTKRWLWVQRINSLRPSDAIWRQWSWTTLAQVMACCLTAPSHYLNQCWLIIRGVLWHTSESSFAGIAQGIDSGYEFEKDILKNIFKSPRGQWVKCQYTVCKTNKILCIMNHLRPYHWGGWGCEVSCGGHHRPRGKTTTGSALDGAVFDIAQILAYLVHNMSRSQLHLGFGYFVWLPSFFGQ